MLFYLTTLKSPQIQSFQPLKVIKKNKKQQEDFLYITSTQRGFADLKTNKI